MQAPTESIRTGNLTGRATRRRHAARHITLRRLARAFTAWWADDSMHARFVQQREHDDQILHRHGR